MLDIAPHKPQVLRSDEHASRVIALRLPAGEALEEHQVHEHALAFLTRGQLMVRSGDEQTSLAAPALVHFAPAERHEVRAVDECDLVLCLAPWPGPGHPSESRPV